MYLKSIQVHGFKSFANKMVLEFHNGITGIVGPNGSGKSNVSDAVRWVLGEQSAKQLRGASMQDVIFSGTENRKPLSYAYVAITMDNSDHMLDIDYEEVTVARRVYRSGESEYLLNGSPCRLKDVNELFYDTGIGKEGYSIIGQGQIEKILNGRPEERRELFDEAAGIVKYKRRKAAAQKKLEIERENLVRIHDILSELERQIGPLERQSEKAKAYLKKREELKTLDVNFFLLESEHAQTQLKEALSNYEIAQNQLKETTVSYEKIKEEYEKIESAIEVLEQEIEEARERLNQSALAKSRMEGQLSVLEEQIKAAELLHGQVQSRREELDQDRQEKISQKASYEDELAGLEQQLSNCTKRREQAQNELKELQEIIGACNNGLEKSQKEQLELLNRKADMQANQQKYHTAMEQMNIRGAQLNQRLLQHKSEESVYDELLEEQQRELLSVREEISRLQQQEAQLSKQRQEWEQKLAQTERNLSEETAKYHKAASRLESLKNIAERYDGYGNSIRRVMEQRENEPGILGVVSDLIKVDRQYETAIETALGGSIQNIVTEDEQTAKRMITYLKENRLGRATFLPLTAVKGSGGIRDLKALSEPGVIGLANTLVQTDEKYRGITAQLLGRVIVVDTIDHAVSLARAYRYSLSIVTVGGEFLRPGGSMTGGAFKNSSNLLGRNREIEELTRQVQAQKQAVAKHSGRREEILTAQALLADDLQEVNEKLQQQYLAENTAQLNADRTKQQKEAGEDTLNSLRAERKELDLQIREIRTEKERAIAELEAIGTQEEALTEESRAYQEQLDEKLCLEESVSKACSKVQMEEANLRQRMEFALENRERVAMEIEKCGTQEEELLAEAEQARKDAKQKKKDMEEIRQSIQAEEEAHHSLEQKLQEKAIKSRQMSEEQKGFFDRREEVSKNIGDLDKEIFRLNSQKEKLEEDRERRISYIWEEYELTPHAAARLRSKAYEGLSGLRQQIGQIKEEIRGLGDVNVGAIEEYKEVSGRYEFLKNQHDDLILAEEALVKIIEDLDTGMRAQFTEKFAEIQHEFDRSFKELFGGGKGTLELVEGEDILECGIRIIAQPPGKKLQNMILLSGGEKSLTAIALLFAIQNLKPSPFCLLDEIEAALDDSNVGRFAKYLHKLTKNTQFIVITHRRGTMASADRLYGITMQEKGVSTLVSVDLIEHDLQ